MKRTISTILCAILLLFSCTNVFACEANIPPADQISVNPAYAYDRWESNGFETAGNQSRAGEDGLAIMFAESSISPGTGSVRVSATTETNISADFVGGTVQIQVYRNNNWQAYRTFVFERIGCSATVTKNISVDSGYYYRVVVSHKAITPYSTVYCTTSTRSILVN